MRLESNSNLCIPLGVIRKYFERFYKGLCHLIVLMVKMVHHAPSRLPAARRLTQEPEPAPTPSAERDCEQSPSRTRRALVAKQVEQSGRCPHCGDKKFRRWGTTAAGEQRYRCKACAKTFTGLTGTPLNGVHHKHQLLDYEHCMKAGLSVREAAAELSLHRNVVFRWRHRLMPQLDVHQPHSLEGVAEVDEAFFRESFKGLKHSMPRKAHKRAMPAGKRGISREQIPVLTAVARGSRSSYMAVLPGTPNAPNITAALGSVLAPDAVLVSDSASAYKTAAKTLGVVGRQIPSGTHKLGPYHIQNVK